MFEKESYQEFRQRCWEIFNKIIIKYITKSHQMFEKESHQELRQSCYEIFSKISSKVQKRFASNTSSKVSSKISSKLLRNLQQNLIKSLKKVSSKVSSKISSKLWRNLQQNLIKSCEIKLQYFDEKSNCCERRKFALVEEKSKVTERAVSPSRVTLTHQISSNKKTFIDRKKDRQVAKKIQRQLECFRR